MLLRAGILKAPAFDFLTSFLTAFDPDTDIDQVDLSSGLDELRQRLEILLGAVPEAPVDASALRETGQQLERQQSVAEAGS